MVTDNQGGDKKDGGPTGFIEVGGHLLLVDQGKVYREGTPVGILYEDGYLRSLANPQAGTESLKLIDDVSGCTFQGIDSTGLELELPGHSGGPSGEMIYNNIPMTVVKGRIATADHKLLGEFTDQGELSLRDALRREPHRRLDELSQLNTVFEGKRADDEPWRYEFMRPLYKKDRRYWENEVIRYFEGFDGLNTAQKRFTFDGLRIWARTGILQIIRKSEGTCGLGNVKHGASGVTGVRSGMVTLDRDEFEKEIELTRRFGTSWVVATRIRPYVEARLNLVVSHEFGHQLEFCLSSAAQERINRLYQERLDRCDRMHPLPAGYEGLSELLLPQQVQDRIFISGYGRTSMHEYWAEAVAAFSIKNTREDLERVDPSIHDLITELVEHPERMVRPVFSDTILALQTSLRAGGELTGSIWD